ncbi:MAG: pilus assembly PilX N-terminal domain-containing protein [Verrucomicrobiota bacterium]
MTQPGNSVPADRCVAGRRGVALVVTLIMLAVITFMAVTFLVLSHRERASVSTTTDLTTARLAAQTALERATAEAVARMMALENDQAYDFAVSTNFINRAGFYINPTGDVFTNVNYEYLLSHSLISGLADPVNTRIRLSNLTNLLYNPRPPVFVTNRLTGRLEFRYYLDLNRNGLYDTNGFLPVISPNAALPFINANNGNLMASPLAGVTLSNSFVGDPEWIGVLERSDHPHAPDNRFLARFAYVIVPVGKTLDVNYIHNQAQAPTKLVMDNFGQEYFRNEGAGSWEINLAAFLYDLNTNYYAWGPTYLYDVSQYPVRVFEGGTSFTNAESIYRYRLNGPGTSYAYFLGSAQNLFPNGALTFRSDQVDEYSDGPLMTGTLMSETAPGVAADNVAMPWPGADNPYHFYTHQDFFDPEKVGPGFVTQLAITGTNRSSYDRYTFYRLMAQLGTDSMPEEDKINVNYVNYNWDAYNINSAYLPGGQTNLEPWSATAFFNIAADRLLRTNTLDWITAGPTASNIFYLTFGVRTNFGLANPSSATNGNGTPAIMGIPVYSYYWYNTNVDAYHPTGRATNVLWGYTDGVQRLLQLTANLYDATTNRFALFSGTNTLQAPTVWRPILRYDQSRDMVLIVGYREIPVAGAPLINGLTFQTNGGTVLWKDLENVNDRQSIPLIGTPWVAYPGTEAAAPEPMAYGIPLIIGAKRGFPSFNKFAMHTSLTATRKLGFHRNTADTTYPASYTTNEDYLLGITNWFGVQAWNSYSNDFLRNIRIIAAGEVTLTLATNWAGSAISRSSDNALLNRTIYFTFATNLADWRGFLDIANHPDRRTSFLSFVTNTVFLTNSAYLYGANRFYPFATNEAGGYFPTPEWWFFHRAKVRYVLYDTAAQRILDYVNLTSADPALNVLDAMQYDAVNCDTLSFPDSGPVPGDFWCTNRHLANGTTLTGSPLIPTVGIQAQIAVCLGPMKGGINVSDSIWRSFNATTEDKQNGIANFGQNLRPTPSQLKDGIALRDFSAPFNPTRTIHQYTTWEANDPLVHYTIPDLTDRLGATNVLEWDSTVHDPIARLSGAGQGNPMADHYRPWGGNPDNPSETSYIKTLFDPAVKDPGMVYSDAWNFPTNKFPNIGWLGRVHRGSPWQTVYLKSPDYTNTLDQGYALWAGDTNLFDAYYLGRPGSDRLLFDIFTTAINDNASRGRLSINQTNFAAWSAVLSGIPVLSNSVAGSWTNIQPAGSDFNSPLVAIVNGINATRATFPGGSFHRLGDILATPQFTMSATNLVPPSFTAYPGESPYLSTVGGSLDSYGAGGLNDEIIERIPQQAMSLLGLSHAPRFVIYSYGQALHPAERSIYTVSGPFFQLCTNYQVTAEAATRAVVRVEGAPSNPRVIVEQFNVLPAD